MIEGTFDHRLRTRLAVLFKQVPLQRTGVDADTHGAAVVLGRLHHRLHPLGRTNIAWIDAQTCRPRFRRLDRPFVVEMDVGDDRHLDFAHNLAQRLGRCLVRAGDPHDIGAGVLKFLDLCHGGGDIRGQRVGHRLHADGGITANGDLADVDFAACTPLNITIGPHAHRPTLKCC